MKPRGAVSRTPAPRKGGGRLVSSWATGLGALVLAGLLAGALVDCGGNGGDSSRRGADADTVEVTMTVDDVSTVLDRHKERLMSVPGVIGVYVGARHDSSLCIRVIILEGRGTDRSLIPDSLEGIPVEVEESDPIRPL